MRFRFVQLIVLLSFVTISCKKNYDLASNAGSVPVAGDSTIAPATFDFVTTKSITIKVKLTSDNDEVITGVPVKIYADDPLTTSPVYTALTDENGLIAGTVLLPQYIDTLIVDPEYVGLMRYAKVYLTNNTLTATIGGKNGYGGNIVESNSLIAEPTFKSLTTSSDVMGATYYSYMGKYDSYGVPTYLEPQTDVVSAQLLSFVNASLPERIPLPVSHPDYLQSGNVTDLNITASSDIWITFVSEGAGYRNTLGYFTYPTDNTPTIESGIDTIHYIFPNASLPYSGGNLASGSKVHLGKFNSGTSIGFVLLANAWNGSGVTSSGTKYYSEPALNPETEAGLQQHTVLLYAKKQNLFLVGFEDLNRQNGSDNDFNDVVFYASSNPVTAISTNNVQPIDEPVDADKDGISDKFDQYPLDPARAFNNYYPSATTYGTLAFEDLWPTTGDYDMNDLVVNYRYKYVTNGKGNVVEVYGDYYVKAAGATFKNGFGVQFPFSTDVVSKVTGQKLISNYISIAANGAEASQSKAVIIPFDNYNALSVEPSGFQINTQVAAPVVKSDTAHVFVSFKSPISLSAFGTAPFNPFLISNLRRGYEVHLPGSLPTDLANTKLFGTAQDYTRPLYNYYYKSIYAWPWALNFAEPFDYPSERNAIGTAYNHFLQWAQSGGTKYIDWYKNLPGYRNADKIYSK